ncbi:hypothetical protein B0H15DRAFT_532459 [Mycena belliarum]|uniref:Uncharacterized protein n=1 Tax=Mycena belliarum TaxID=1033014 RepID=A0AAD6TXE8_9AGAR|nr:hypothetical protein B0H15DRAFT_532459 [Mycena belliae]
MNVERSQMRYIEFRRPSNALATFRLLSETNFDHSGRTQTHNWAYSWCVHFPLFYITVQGSIGSNASLCFQSVTIQVKSRPLRVGLWNPLECYCCVSTCRRKWSGWLPDSSPIFFPGEDGLSFLGARIRCHASHRLSAVPAPATDAVAIAIVIARAPEYTLGRRFFSSRTLSAPPPLRSSARNGRREHRGGEGGDGVTTIEATHPGTRAGSCVPGPGPD